MKRLLASSLVLCLAATTGLASAQTYQFRAPTYGQDGSTRYDYARVLRVDPVFDSRYGSRLLALPVRSAATSVRPMSAAMVTTAGTTMATTTHQ